MNIPSSERGAALLTILLLVAVMATIAATAMDRIGVATRLTANAATVAQARSWLTTAEQLAMTRIEDLLAADQSQTLGTGWLGAERSIDLPDGAKVRARIEDAGNCFNLNSLVERQQDGTLKERAVGGDQFKNLMRVLGIGAGEADRIASVATDFVDSDSAPLPAGSEGGANAVPNGPMSHASELRAVAGVTPRHYAILERWLCALPSTDLSPINVNTLQPEQAPLLAMLAPTVIDVARARSQIASRPADGFGSVLNFWSSGALRGVEVPDSVSRQVQVRTGFFKLRASVGSANSVGISETALIDARAKPARLVMRQWGEAG